MSEKQRRESVESFRLRLLKERSRELHAVDFESLCESRSYACGSESPEHLPVLVYTLALENKYFLHRDRFAFHTGDFGNGGDATRTVCKSCHLDDEVDRRCDLLAHGTIREPHASHLNHRFEPGQSIAWGVCVNSGQ